MWTVTIKTQKQDERMTLADPTFQCSSDLIGISPVYSNHSINFQHFFQRKRRLKQDSTKTGVPIAPGALRESGLCALGAMSGSPDKVGDMGEGCLKNMEN